MSKFDPYQHLHVSLNSDGTLTRHLHLPTASATGETTQKPGQAVLSKDVTLNSDKKTWMRIYLPAKLPSNDRTVARLPIIFYFHPGGWIQMSISNTILHEYNNRIAAEIPSIIIAVEFRLAPENRLPAQYDDAAEAIYWARNQVSDQINGDHWIREYGDYSRCYLYGSSCGANIAYNAAMMIMQEPKVKPLKIAGVILNQPFFGAEERVNSEMEMGNDEYLPLPVQDLLWELALPVGADRDHRFSNPFVDKVKVKSIGRCLVIGFGGDPLIDRQRDFVKMLVQQGVMVEERFDDVGFHGVDLVDTRRATSIINFIKVFV